jgi:hypothetical protein
VPTPIIDWNARWVMLTGGWSAGGIVSSPTTGFEKELRAISEPMAGMSRANRAWPSTSSPPIRSGAGC